MICTITILDPCPFAENSPFFYPQKTHLRAKYGTKATIEKFLDVTLAATSVLTGRAPKVLVVFRGFEMTAWVSPDMDI
jgi:hypothetical protein